MKVISYKWVLIVLLSVFVLSCKKDSETSDSSPGGLTSTNGLTSTSSATARYAQNCTLEDYTATWCTWCPAAKTTTEAAVKAYGDRVIPMEFHADDHPDELTFNGTVSLQRTLYTRGGGYPIQLINRKIVSDPYSVPGANYMIVPAQIGPLITTTSSSRAISSTVGLAISSKLSGATLSITVKSRFAQAMSGVKLVVYVLESGIITASRSNPYSGNVAFNNPSYILYPLYSAPDPLTNYSNDHVVRASATAVLGDAIPDQAAATEYTKTYAVTIPAEWKSNNLSIAAMIVKTDNTLLNAQQAKVDSSKDFEILIP